VILLALPALAAAAYYLLALIAAARWGRPEPRRSPYAPAISILKPIQGRDPGFYACIRSHAAQHYPEFEILFGVSDPGDPAIADIASLQSEFQTWRFPSTSFPPPRPTPKPACWPSWRARPATRSCW
jgi:hypothetical protein